MTKKEDVNAPILVLIRRGRMNRGFMVSPIEDLQNPAPCSSARELGDVISEMMNDENQPRVDLNSFSNGSLEKRSSDRREYNSNANEKSNNYEEEESDDSGLFNGVSNAENPADRLVENFLGAVIRKGRSISKPHSSKVNDAYRSANRTRIRKKKR